MCENKRTGCLWAVEGGNEFEKDIIRNHAVEQCTLYPVNYDLQKKCPYRAKEDARRPVYTPEDPDMSEQR